MLQPTAKIPYQKWMPPVLALISGLTLAGIIWIIGPSYQILFSAAAFLMGVTAVMLFVSLLRSFFQAFTQDMNSQFSRQVTRLIQVEEELRSMITIRPVLAGSLVSFNGWAVEARTGEQLIGLFQEVRTQPGSTGLVVECGSGASTVLLARYMQQCGEGRIVSLDHDRAFADKTRLAIRDGGLEDIATVMDAPLRECNVNGFSRRWYDFDPAYHLKETIDLLIVDGPPGRSSSLARYPAVPMLRECLRPGSIIILHDAHRPDEKKTALMWAGELGVQPELHPNGKGAWVVRLASRTISEKSI